MAAYEVTNVSEEQIDDPAGSGDLVDAYNITFKIDGHPGDFTEQVLASGDPVTEAYNKIVAKLTQVNAIYSGSSGGT